MVQHYAERFRWIFKYTNKNFGYCLLKTLCIMVGLPIYLVCFVVEMVLTLVNMIFSLIPIVGLLVMLVCKVLMWVVDKLYYICVLPDIKKFYMTTHDMPDYVDVTHLSQPAEQPVAPTEDEA